ncbi:MAG: AAA family ATPase, partial [Abditibacteriota bacterium]|nr:AAA family ATPase [Abditibacteriota bacterium]
RIQGARQYERLLSKQTDEEQLFGRVDLSSLIPGSVPEAVLKDDPAYAALRSSLEQAISNFAANPGDSKAKAALTEATEKAESYRKAVGTLRSSEPMVQTTGKIPESDICFLDEIFKCNDGVLNSLLTALNERKYTNEGRTYPIPVISFFAASNEIPNFNDPQEKILQALYDRLELKAVTADIADRDKRLSVLRNKQSGVVGRISATITLDELRMMQQEVASIPVPDSVNELADDILCELRKNIRVSDRKYLNYYPIAQARAWLNGHASVETTDLLALKCYLWEKPTDLPAVEATLTRMCVNPLQDKVNDIRAAAKEVIDELAVADDAKVDRLKSFRKFRGEMVRIYGLYKELSGKAQTDSEKAMTDALLADLEKESRSAHEKHGFTYATLEELAAFQ